jgi:hypothetical protein
MNLDNYSSPDFAKLTAKIIGLSFSGAYFHGVCGERSLQDITSGYVSKEQLHHAIFNRSIDLEIYLTIIITLLFK